MQTNTRKTLHHLQEANKVFKRLSIYCKIYLWQTNFKIRIYFKFNMFICAFLQRFWLCPSRFVLVQCWDCDTSGEPWVVLATGWTGCCFPCNPRPCFTSASGELMALASYCLGTFLSKPERENYFLRASVKGKQKRIKSLKLSLFV